MSISNLPNLCKSDCKINAMKYIKYTLQFFAVVLISILSSCGSSHYATGDNYSNEYSQGQGITYQQFYNDLSPYGNWINYPGYGYVWMPGVSGFRPYYSNGRWAYTNYGWTWVSDYSWGWAPFHYGRWINPTGYGWMWIPGNEWAPAWVAWRGGGEYYGWAPLGPGMNIHASGGSIPYNNWAFVPRQYINSPRINNYYVNQSRNVNIVNNTTIINNTTINNGSSRSVYNPGPPVRDVENVTGAPIRRLTVVESGRPGNPQITNNELNVYRPPVQRQASNATNIKPSRVTDLSEIERNDNSNNEPPVRKFPADQTPQINRNEPPVNNGRPSVSSERNNAPVRTYPNQNPPAEIERRPQLQNNPRTNEAPVRSPQRENTRPAEAPPQRSIPPENKNTNPAPVRQFDNSSRHSALPGNAAVRNMETSDVRIERIPEPVKR
jgi:hypothetical protein